MFWQGNALERNLAGMQKRAYVEIIRLYGLWLCAERKLFVSFTHPKLVHIVRRSQTDNRTCRVATFAALALDIHTQRKTARRGVYAMPEDDKDAQKLNDLKAIPSVRVLKGGYDMPTEQDSVITGSGSTWQIPEEDIAYHNRYGAEQEAHGPVEIDADHNRLIQH
jgi:hypothetical protein